MSPGPAPALPPLVLRCRPVWRIAHGAAALALLVLGTDALVRSVAGPSSGWLTIWAPPILLAAGAACAYFVARFCFAALVLDDDGFRLRGPLVDRDVSWTSVIGWSRLPQRGGPAVVRIVHGPGRRRLTIPLIYEDSHVLELGLGQRRFPKY
ncbi:MAG: hypothetical protein HY510_00400 [Acidobacteria bacterium]|nr:hypothetical protein [Acidobacteriota bacterium]